MHRIVEAGRALAPLVSQSATPSDVPIRRCIGRLDPTISRALYCITVELSFDFQFASLVVECKIIAHFP